MAEQFQNFFVTKLREACDATATTIYVDTVPAITEGTLVLEYANSTKHEIIHFTGVSGYGLTGCTRGLEGTTAQSHSAGTDVRQNLTAGIIDKIINGVITTENIADSAVTTAKINDGAVTSDKIDFTTLGGNYSTSEVNTGFTWVDGKPIYKKTLYRAATGAASSITINTGITNGDMLVNLEVIAKATGGKYVFPIIEPGQWETSVRSVSSDLKTILINTNLSTTIATADIYATIYYTKTS